MSRSCPDDAAGCMIRKSSRYGTPMADPWTYVGPVAPLTNGRGTVTLVDESTFAISAESGDISPGAAQGPLRPGHPDPLPLRGARRRGPDRAPGCDPRRPLLGHLRLALPAGFGAGRLDADGLPYPPRRPGDARGARHSATSPTRRARARSRSSSAPTSPISSRSRRAGREPSTWHGEIVPSLRPEGDGAESAPRGQKGPATITYSYRRGGVARAVELRVASHSSLSDDLVTFDVIVPARGEWSTCIEVAPVIEGNVISPKYRCGQPIERADAERAARPVAPPGPPGRDRPSRAEGGHRPERRGSRRAAHLRPRLSRAGGRRRRCAVVHDGVRPRLAPHRVDGPAGRPRSGPRRAADPGPVPGQGGRSAPRRGARSHPPRDALRRPRRRCPSAAGASTTAPPTRPRSS